MQTLRQAREARGIKQEAVARALNVSRQTYSKYEKNPENMPVRLAHAACSFIGCDMREIFFA